MIPSASRASRVIGVTARRTAAVSSVLSSGAASAGAGVDPRYACSSRSGCGGDLPRGAAHHDAAVVEDRHRVSDLERQADVLLDEHHRAPVVGRDLADRAEQALDDDRREAHAQLVDQQHLRSLDQRPRHREHLLLAARERAGAQLPPRLERGEERRASIVVRGRGDRTRTRRFSSTVSVVNNSRLSGTSTMPARLGRGCRAGLQLARRRSRSTRRAQGRRPGDREQQRRLARAVRTEDRVDRAASTERSTSRKAVSDPQPPRARVHSSRAVMSRSTRRATCRGRRPRALDRRGSSPDRPARITDPKSST